MSVTLGESLTIRGLFMAAFTCCTTSESNLGLWPISAPVCFTWGQETLSSIPSAPASAAFLATAA